jgi:hypothetical protein
MVYSTFDNICCYSALHHPARIPPPMKAVILGLWRQKFERRRVFLALAFFIVAQFGAQLHTYAHDAAALGTAHQTILVTHSVCDECLAYAPLLSAAATPARLPRLPGPARSCAPAQRFLSFLDHGPILAFRSRAPPEAPPA